MPHKHYVSITSQDLSLPKAVHRSVYWPSDRAKHGKKIHLHFSVVWIGSRSTFVFCTALVTGRLSLSDTCTLELAILWTLLAVTPPPPKLN